ncbi:MAG: PspC domain-containing protein [Chloroflexus sp.]|uniref:PspC domain-containing protein n=1 Tax=Chloroflexus sp. TaxID=1904827 RepID=UPI00404B5AC0
MNTPQTQRLQRLRNDRMLAGVASGLAQYIGVDPVITRLVFVVLGLVNGMGVLFYILLWLLMPNEDADPTTNNLHTAIGEMRVIMERFLSAVRDVFQR